MHNCVWEPSMQLRFHQLYKCYSASQANLFGTPTNDMFTCNLYFFLESSICMLSVSHVILWK